jgi:hypothetical protein
MKFETTIVNMNGSWYARLPPAFAKHMGVDIEKEDYKQAIPAEIQDEKGKHGNYCSIWKKDGKN